MAPPPTDRDDEGFASRWSRLKQQSRNDQPRADALTPAPEQPVAPVEPAPDKEKAQEAEKPFDPSTLPPVESLTKESDYSVFMRSEVPEELRQKALRRLWASDPILSAPEILDMHNLDYNNVPIFPEGLRTLFRVGQGMLDSLEAEAEEKAAAKPPKSSQTESAEPQTTSLPDQSAAAPQHDGDPVAHEVPEKPAKS
jgi:Protein of unknown function (DUF3306)